MRDRWDIYDNCPIEETGKLCYLLRRVSNADESRAEELMKIINKHKNIIIFYNFDYELEGLREVCDYVGIRHAEWNGHKHEPVPTGDPGWVYLVQYSAGCEAWNCIASDCMVFYSQNYSYKTMEQAAGRIDRANTPFKDLYYYHFRSSSPIDLAIKRALSLKKDFNEKIFMKGATITKTYGNGNTKSS